MKNTRQRDTRPELQIRSLLHRAGYRFFVNHPILEDRRRRADIVFPKLKVAIFVDGCFWHGCPTHGTWPKNNASWWREKIERNQHRDADTVRKLRKSGWLPIRIWEHESPTKAIYKIEKVLVQKRGHPE